MKSGKPQKPLFILLLLAMLAMLILYVTRVMTNGAEPLPANWKGIYTGYQAVE